MTVTARTDLRGLTSEGGVITTRRRGQRVKSPPREVIAAINEARDDLARRETLIREAAYFLAQRRGFEPGHEVEDWLAAERQVDAAAAARDLPLGFYG